MIKVPARPHDADFIFATIESIIIDPDNLFACMQISLSQEVSSPLFSEVKHTSEQQLFCMYTTALP